MYTLIYIYIYICIYLSIYLSIYVDRLSIRPRDSRSSKSGVPSRPRIVAKKRIVRDGSPKRNPSPKSSNPLLFLDGPGIFDLGIPRNVLIIKHKNPKP